MRTLKGVSDTITGILHSSKGSEREKADKIIEFLFEEDNLVIPPKQDYNLKLKMFNDFFKWHKSSGREVLKSGDFQEWLWTL